MSLRVIAPKHVCEEVRILIGKIVVDAFWDKANSVEQFQKAASSMAKNYSICLVCLKIKKHDEFRAYGFVISTRCRDCTPKPEIPRPYKRPKNRHARKYWANRDKILKYGREWTKKNPAKVQAMGRNVRARRIGVPGTHTAEEWATLCAKFDFRCVCCGRSDRPLTADHIISTVRIGCTNDISNIQPLCQECNSVKGADCIDFRQTPFIKSGIELFSPLRALRRNIPDPTLDGW